MTGGKIKRGQEIFPQWLIKRGCVLFLRVSFKKQCGVNLAFSFCGPSHLINSEMASERTEES